MKCILGSYKISVIVSKKFMFAINLTNEAYCSMESRTYLVNSIELYIMSDRHLKQALFFFSNQLTRRQPAQHLCLLWHLHRKTTQDGQIESTADIMNPVTVSVR